MRRWSFVLPTDAAVLRVLKMYTRISELLAYLIGTFEIAAFFGGNAFGDQLLDLFGAIRGRRRRSRVARSFSSSSSASTARIASNFSMAARTAGASCCRNSPRSIAVLTSRTRSKISGEREGGVHVVGEARVEVGFGLSHALDDFGIRSGGKCSVFSARRNCAGARRNSRPASGRPP